MISKIAGWSLPMAQSVFESHKDSQRKDVESAVEEEFPAPCYL